MIQLKDFMEISNYKITEGGEYGWDCYGKNAYTLTSWNQKHSNGGWSTSITFDTILHTVYEVDVCDFTNNRAYRLINSDFTDAHNKEAETRGVIANNAWDNVNFIDLDVDADWMEKAEAIILGKEYDTRVQIEVEFSDDDLLEYMKLAHKLDITFNELIVQAVKNMIENNEKNQ
jgi:outer membrane cobalamin receptor